MRFDRRRRWLLIVRADGRLAAVAIDRNSNVVAWSLLESVGRSARSRSTTASRTSWSQLGGQMLLERFDEALTTDHAVTLTSADADHVWSGLRPSRRARGRSSRVPAPPARRMVVGGTVTSPAPAQLGHRRHRLRASRSSR